MRSARALLALYTLSAPGPRQRACRCLCCAPRPRTASAIKPATGAWDHLAEEANGGVRPQLSESFYVSPRRPL
eukprot:scaffold68725_cov68-Phaeocystis_antarctica.AAC.2